MGGPTERQVVAVKSISGCGAEEWSDDRLLPGDVIDQVRAMNKIMLIVNSPFHGGKSALQRELRKIHQAGETALVRVRRGGSKVDLQVCVTVEESMMRKKVYLLADSSQRSYVAYLMDATEDECLALQDQSRKVMEKLSSLPRTLVKDRLMTYPWQAKMQQFLPSPNSAMVFSLILMPFQRTDGGGTAAAGDGDLEDTTARAMAWLSASQSSGVPIIFVNIQSEPLFIQTSTSKYFGSAASEDPLELINSGMYALHDLEGTEINVTRAIRLWYSPPEGELAVTLTPKDSELRLGVNITCTEEGFCYVSSVDGGTAADRAGLLKVYEAACSANKLLVVSRVAGEKVTPWFVSSSGAIRCFDAVSISEKISASRQAREAVEFYFMVWSGATQVSRRRAEAAESQSLRCSVSSDSEKFESTTGDSPAQTGQGNGSEVVALTPEDESVELRSSSTRSFSFHDEFTPGGHEKPESVTAHGDEFSFTP